MIAAARANGKWSGVHFGSAAPLAPWLSRGMQINMCGSDNGLLALGAARDAQAAGRRRGMKIVVLDGYTENPGDLSWAGFEALGSLTVYDRTPLCRGKH